MKKTEKLLGVFYSLIIILIILIAYFFIPFSQNLKQALFPVAAVLGFAFLVLGVVLLWLTKKSKIKGKLRVFLMLIGISAIGPFIGAILHNFFYALGIYFKDIIFVKNIMQILGVIFFLLALIGFPILFLVGMVGAIILFYKKKK